MSCTSFEPNTMLGPLVPLDSLSLANRFSPWNRWKLTYCRGHGRPHTNSKKNSPASYSTNWGAPQVGKGAVSRQSAMLS